MSAATMLEAMALGAPTAGRMSKAARTRATKRLARDLFGEGGLAAPRGPERSERDALLAQARELRELAARGMKPRAYAKRAAELEARAGRLNVPVYVNGKRVASIERRLTVPERHQLRIAQQTLRMHPTMAAVMGGPTPAEARRIVRALTARRNPRLGTVPHSPGSPCLADEAELYQDVERIYARKGSRASTPRERYFHDFRHAAACGRPDGTVVLRGRERRRLWRLFEAED